MFLLSHPTGNTFVRALLKGLQESKRLGIFATTLGFAGEPRWAKLLPHGLRRELQRRSYELPPSRIRRTRWVELARLASQRWRWSAPVRHEAGWASVDAVYGHLDRYVAAHLPKWHRDHGLSVAYAYEDAALETLQIARRHGMAAVYDLPIAYWETSRRLLEAEARRLPDWEHTLVGTADSPAKLDRKTREIEAADIVVCPSKFVLESIPAKVRDSKKCVVAEFGSPGTTSKAAKPRRPDEKLRVLFAGSMTQRKGLADLFAAFDLLKGENMQLVVMGSPVASLEFYRSKYPDFIYEPTRPHEAVLDLMATCHVLCLPSIVEGRALVQQEAMSVGLPIVVTSNAGGEDLVVEGETGFLVPPGEPEAIAQMLEWFLAHPDQWEPMSSAAQKRAAALTWSRYTARILDQIA